MRYFVVWTPSQDDATTEREHIVPSRRRYLTFRSGRDDTRLSSPGDDTWQRVQHRLSKRTMRHCFVWSLPEDNATTERERIVPSRETILDFPLGERRYLTFPSGRRYLTTGPASSLEEDDALLRR